jgi:release factor glutamine methyltransferase
VNSTSKEAEWLLKEKYDGIESDAYREDLLRLEQGEPVDYVIGFSKFLGCKIDLSYKPLIPRTETEYWVEKAIAELPKDRPQKCLDVFSGSGCIGIAVLKKMPNASMDFAEIDERLTSQIKKNLEVNGIDPARCGIYQSDIFKNIPAGKKYDVIFANPPYIADAARVDASVLDYEPHKALFAEDNGMFFIEKTVERIHELLIPGGVLYLECDDFQYEPITQLCERKGIRCSFHKDQFGLYRWAKLAF